MATSTIFEFLDEKEAVYQDIHGTFEYLTFKDGRRCLYFNPSEQGRQTKEYQWSKQHLGDDWSFDLTNNVEAYCAIATELGYVEESQSTGGYMETPQFSGTTMRQFKQDMDLVAMNLIDVAVNLNGTAATELSAFVAAQSGKGYMISVRDDGSTDPTILAAAKALHERIQELKKQTL